MVPLPQTTLITVEIAHIGCIQGVLKSKHGISQRFGYAPPATAAIDESTVHVNVDVDAAAVG